MTKAGAKEGIMIDNVEKRLNLNETRVVRREEVGG